MPVPLTTAIRLSPAALAVLLLAAPAAASTLQVLYHADDEGSSGANLLTPVLVSGGGVMTGTLNGRGGTDSDSGDVFLLSPGKKGAAYTKTLLHVFAGGNDGTSPTSLIADKRATSGALRTRPGRTMQVCCSSS